MKKIWKMLSAVLITAAMVSAMTMAPAGAAEKNYDGLVTTPTNPTVSFDKYLLMETTTGVPSVTFNFTLSAVAADATLGTTEGILTGVKYNNATSATNQVSCSFTNASTTYTSVQGNDDLTVNAGYKYAKETMTLDFSGVDFKEPGIYAYKLTESTAGTGSAAVSGTDRYLYVYVEDATTVDPTLGEINKLDIGGYLLTTADDSFDATYKSKGFTNQFPACTLTFGKEVTGNQGSRDKFFKFTVKVTAATITNTDEFIVDMTNAVSSPAGNSATTYDAADMVAANNVQKITGKQLSDGYDFYLQDGNYVTIVGIPENYSYEITEAAEEYTATSGITAANSSLDWDGTAGVDALADAATGTNISADIYTGFTNNKTGTIPTGVLMSVGPVVIIGLAVAGGIVFLAVRSAKRKAMEAAEEDLSNEE
ncbi:MAG: hypothetical protein IKG01_06660 [Lachnospiraceae bacterium]|nr:hypothetical protein [Lachnospiraceae bacterium]